LSEISRGVIQAERFKRSELWRISIFR